MVMTIVGIKTDEDFRDDLAGLDYINQLRVQAVQMLAGTDSIESTMAALQYHLNDITKIKTERKCDLSFSNVIDFKRPVKAVRRPKK